MIGRAHWKIPVVQLCNLEQREWYSSHDSCVHQQRPYSPYVVFAGQLGNFPQFDETEWSKLEACSALANAPAQDRGKDLRSNTRNTRVFHLCFAKSLGCGSMRQLCSIKRLPLRMSRAIGNSSSGEDQDCSKYSLSCETMVRTRCASFDMLGLEIYSSC